jgi:1,4-dihydroxy-2-naphthoate octaprenyltransferase
VKVIARILDWVLFTSFFAACCAVGLCMATERLINTFIPPLFTSLHVLVFGATLVVYNAHHLVKKGPSNGSIIQEWIKRYKVWQFIFFGCGVAMCIASLFFVSWKIILGCVVLACLSFMYSLPLLPFKNKRHLRDFGWVKILVLDSVWTIVTTILPILYWDKNITDFPLEIAIRFSFLFTICMAFDIRDMQDDLELKIYTLPNLIGLKNSYRLQDATIVIFAVLSIVQYFRFPVPERLVGELITAVLIKIVMVYIKKYPSDRAYLGIVDGLMLMYALLVLLH